MGDVMYSGILLFTLSGVRLAFLARNPRDKLNLSIILIGVISLLIICGRIMGFKICTPPVISDL